MEKILQLFDYLDAKKWTCNSITVKPTAIMK